MAGDDVTLDEAREAFRIYLRHLVGLAGVYEHVGSGGAEPQQPFYFTSAVYEVRGQWFLGTAGHILQKIEAVLARTDTRTRSLWPG